MKKFMWGDNGHTSQFNLYAQEPRCSTCRSNMRDIFQGTERGLAYNDDLHNVGHQEFKIGDVPANRPFGVHDYHGELVREAQDWNCRMRDGVTGGLLRRVM